jgi:hypothetical protein
MAFKTLAFDSPAYSHVRQGQHTAEACGAARTHGRDEMRCENQFPFASRTLARIPYRMKFVMVPRSACGASMPAALPASMHCSSHAMLCAMLRMVCSPSPS